MQYFASFIIKNEKHEKKLILNETQAVKFIEPQSIASL
ncbi:MAG: hypothetical protein JWP94_2587 [Mucilaginibacter sp.]|jgi:hypothetical protein|nr:hypothetical protein [Mucilaginibacter sp.]